MISSLHIQGYRGFERFEMSGLGRLNLLVGTNNGGKTSVLESIFLLMSAGDPAALWQVLSRRGESLLTEVPTSPPVHFVEPEVCHLFSGHEIRAGSSLAFSAANEAQRRSVELVVGETSQKSQADPMAPDDDSVAMPRLTLEIKGYPQPPIPLVPLSRDGGLREEYGLPRRSARRTSGLPIFVPPESLTISEMVGLWNSVALTPDESLVLRALQFIDPEIERIAVQVATAHFFYSTGSRGGFIVRHRGTERPIPVGSLGNGIWRMLVLAIAITRCRGGVLLVDEIDTGLHYSVMSQMWKFIFNAAREFDVQVFATTHSYDCVYSLAHICAEADERNPITVQRIEAGKGKAVPYAQDEIRIAAEREIEVR